MELNPTLDETFSGPLYFWADWCSDCKRFAPILADLEVPVGQTFPLIKVDTEQKTGLTEAYAVMSIPTLIIIKHGREVYRFVETYSKQEIREEVIRQLLTENE